MSTNYGYMPRHERIHCETVDEFVDDVVTMLKDKGYPQNIIDYFDLGMGGELEALIRDYADECVDRDAREGGGR